VTAVTPRGFSLAERRDDTDVASRLRVAVTRLHRRLRQQSYAGLSPSQAALLGTVGRLGAPTLGELATAEQVQPPTMTRLVASMEDQGLMTRTADAADRRVARVTLTGEGRRTLQRIRSLKTAFLSERLASLDAADRADMERLISLLEALNEAP
jgi:DNA-binding MarR family transcriptional regulator